MNKLLHEAKDLNQEQELTMIQTENSFGKGILELERLNSIIANEKFDLEELEKRNTEKERDVEKVEADVKKCDVTISKKDRKIVNLNKKIEEVKRIINFLRYILMLMEVSFISGLNGNRRRGDEPTRYENHYVGKEYRGAGNEESEVTAILVTARRQHYHSESTERFTASRDQLTK